MIILGNSHQSLRSWCGWWWLVLQKNDRKTFSAWNGCGPFRLSDSLLHVCRSSCSSFFSFNFFVWLGSQFSWFAILMMVGVEQEVHIITHKKLVVGLLTTWPINRFLCFCDFHLFRLLTYLLIVSLFGFYCWIDFKVNGNQMRIYRVGVLFFFYRIKFHSSIFVSAPFSP